MNRNRKNKPVTLASAAFIAVGAFAFTGGTSSATAAEFTLTGTFGWHSNGNAYALEEGHFFFVGESSGPYFPGDNDEGPVGFAANTSMGTQDVGTETNGFTILSDSAGDRAFAFWGCQNIPADQGPGGSILSCAGAINFYAGTGKFEGISGVGEIRCGTIARHPDGSVSGSCVYNVVYTIPD